jgi:predicted dehydrogenase
MIEKSKAAGRKQPLRYGMVGGGQGSFIGDVHRRSADFDGNAVLVAGCFSRSYENSKQTGEALSLEPQRIYRDYREMAEKEAQREDCIEFVSIVTPNASHYQIARAFLDKGIHVVCDKPMTTELKDAEELVRLTERRGLLFAVTYVYSGYPMMKQARQIVKRGDIGEIRVVVAEYPQDWLATEVEKKGNKQAAWRTDPAESGASNCIGDIGSHIEHSVSYISGLKIKELCASMDIFGKGRKLDDNASILLRYTTGATGVYWCSQVAIGNDNGLRVRIFGTKGSLEFAQEQPNYLKLALLGKPVQTLSRGCDYLYPEAAKISRIPSGHPEGYYEAFANLYTAFAGAAVKKKAGQPLGEKDLDFPGVAEGAQGVRFITRCVESSRNNSSWIRF